MNKLAGYGAGIKILVFKMDVISWFSNMISREDSIFWKTRKKVMFFFVLNLEFWIIYYTFVHHLRQGASALFCQEWVSRIDLLSNKVYLSKIIRDDYYFVIMICWSSLQDWSYSNCWCQSLNYSRLCHEWSLLWLSGIPKNSLEIPRLSVYSNWMKWRK